nr:unnamed protein product [Callosobruchus analis]
MITNDAVFNKINTHYWADQNPRLFKTHQHRFGFNIWAEIFGHKIIGPFVYHGSLAFNRYLNLLRNNVEPGLENLPLRHINNCWFQQYGAPAHNSTAVHEYLDTRFLGKWIGTNSEVKLCLQRKL